MALLKPFDYKLGGIFHPSPVTAEPAMWAYSPNGSWSSTTASSAWWAAFPGAKFYPFFHPGQDLIAPIGTPILAGEAGIVTKAGWSSAASGYAVNVQIRPETTYVHGHLSVVDVQVGQHVARGQLLGRVGQSGYATGPHSHHGIQIGDRLYNPMLFYPGGSQANNPYIQPITSTVKHARLRGGGINIRKTPDLDVGYTNIFATSRAQGQGGWTLPSGIYRGSTKIAAIDYAFIYNGDVYTDDGVFAKLSGPLAGKGTFVYCSKPLVTVY